MIQLNEFSVTKQNINRNITDYTSEELLSND